MIDPKRRAVWVVDDSPLDADRVRRVLAPRYDVAVFGDGASVLERIEGGPVPDVLVLDWVMPGVTGLDVCRYIRGAAGPASQIGIVLVTGFRRTEQIVEGLEAGANDYLAKPFDDAELLARVGALIRNRELLERTERAERANERLLATAPDAIIGVDGEGTVTYANDEATRVFGAAAKDLAGRRLAELVPGLDVGAAGGRAERLDRPDVTIGNRSYAPTVRLRADESGHGTTISLRDVTARRQLDARRLDFYSIVAHDLRSPIGAILMRTDLMLRGKHGLLAAPVIADVQKIDKSLKSIVALINDFLEFTRLESGGYRFEQHELDVRPIVAEVLVELGPLLDAGHLAWKDERPPEPALVQGDRRRLAQVLTNLVSNAIKFTPREGTITTRIANVDGCVEVSVADTGPGIPAGAQASLFERYTRARAVEHEVSGTGLGLMIVREIVEAHGGTVGVESEPGVGSRFWFRLPRARERR